MKSKANGCTAGRVLYFFEQISAIPRRSFVTAPIAEYLCDFARARGLFYLRDGADNVIIKKDASSDAQKKDAVILQAHTDMVFAQADPDAVFNKEQGITLERVGDTLRAKGTSLGADDGIGMAYILAVLDDDTLTHPMIEAVFTSNEEVGLLGAAALDASALSGKMMINLDSDEEGIFTVGCAGGSTATLTLPFRREIKKDCVSLTLSGLPGGHSGADAHKGIASAILLLLSLLEEIGKESPILLAEIGGGEADNAIPAFASARFHCEMDKERILQIAEDFLSRQTLRIGDAAAAVESDAVHPCMGAEDSAALIRTVLSLPSGILAMDAHLKGLPETSLNLGRIRTDADTLTLGYALRSSVNEKCRALEKTLSAEIETAGGTAAIDGIYPAWEYTEASPLRSACVSVFRKKYGYEPTVSVIHAGLECGIFAKKLPGLDCISFGPDNKCIHTAEEALSLSSANRVYDYLTEVLFALSH